jgi:hypothetical protein
MTVFPRLCGRRHCHHSGPVQRFRDHHGDGVTIIAIAVGILQAGEGDLARKLSTDYLGRRENLTHTSFKFNRSPQRLALFM